MNFRNHFISVPTKFGGPHASPCIWTQVTVVDCGSYLHPNCMNAGSIRQLVQWPVNEDAVEACRVLVFAWIIVALIRVPVSNADINYRAYNHIFNDSCTPSRLSNFSINVTSVTRVWAEDFQFCVGLDLNDTHRTSRLGGWHLGFVCGGSRVQMSSKRPYCSAWGSVVPNSASGFPIVPQANWEIVPQIRPQCFIPHSFLVLF
jgi:hypothetical protein